MQVAAGKSMKIEGSANLRKIVVLNPKGGSGKTTLAFNIAGYIAETGRKVALIDMDPLRSSTFWIQNRPARLPFIYGVAAESGQTNKRHTAKPVELPPDIDYAVIDAPGALAPEQLADYTVGSHAIMVPVMPSDIDIHAASRLIRDLLLVARVSRANRRLGIVANRVRKNTLAYRRLMKFLSQLSIAVIGVLRDSQNYVTAAHRGICIHELPKSRVSNDLAQWESITRWLEQCLARPLNERDLRPPEPEPAAARRAGRPAVWLSVAASIIAIVGVAAFLWYPDSPQSETVSLTTPSTGMPAATLSAAAPLELVTAPVLGNNDLLGFPAESGGIAVANDPDVAAANTADGPLTGTVDDPLTASVMREKWQLSGVARSGGTDIVLLMDRSDLSTRRAKSDAAIDGWRVAETGPDYAVLRHGDEVVRLELNESTLD